jgi:hypothetical protein
MLIARFDQMTQEIAKLRELKQQESNARTFSTRAEQLQTPSDQLDRRARIAQEFQRRGIAIPLDKGQSVAFATFTKQLRLITDAYREDPQSIVTATEEQRYAFWEPLKTLPNQARDAILQGWSEYVDSMLPVQQSELLQTLEQLPGFRTHVAQIRQLNGEAGRLRGRLPQSADEIDRIATIAAELKRAWAQLPTEGIPGDVRDFLSAAVAGNAQVAQLTGAVMEWLRKNNLVDSVRISLKA